MPHCTCYLQCWCFDKVQEQNWYGIQESHQCNVWGLVNNNTQGYVSEKYYLLFVLFMFENLAYLHALIWYLHVY